MKIFFKTLYITRKKLDNYELFQGFTLNLTVNIPLDRSIFSGGPEGELRPLPPCSETGAKLLITAGAKLRF